MCSTKKLYYYLLITCLSLVKIITLLGNLKGWPALVLMTQRNLAFTECSDPNVLSCFFCVSSSLREQLSHLLYSFCLIPSHPLNSAVQFSQERVDLNCRITASSSIPIFSQHCKTPFQYNPALAWEQQLWFTCTQQLFKASLLECSWFLSC